MTRRSHIRSRRSSTNADTSTSWSCGGRAIPVLLTLVLEACVPPQTDALPVIARGRHVVIATDRDDAICGGTVAFLDAFLEEGFRAIGEPVPDGFLVHYEWRPDGDVEPGTSVPDGTVVVTSDRLPDEHELAHAIHQGAWPNSAPFLHEGFAVLLDSRRMFSPLTAAPDASVIDGLLGAGSAEDLRYDYAWYLVGQIAYEHGVGGLRALWQAVPPGSSAAEVRAAYEELFGTPIESLFDPWIYTGAMSDGQPTEVPRRFCDFSLCPGPVRPFDGERRWSGVGPFSCADDPDAVGPATGDLWVDPIAVWREYAVEDELGPSTFEVVPGEPEPPSAVFAPCYPTCSDRLPRYEDPPEGYVPLGSTDRYRIQIGTALEKLPVDSAPTLVLSH